MEWWSILILILSTFFFLALIGLPVAFSFFAVNIVAAYVFMGGEAGIYTLVSGTFRSLCSWSFLPIPLFILLGEVLFRTGIVSDMINAVDLWLGRLPGRLGLVAIGGGAIFAAMSGSSMASCAMLGSLLEPEMTKRGYGGAMIVGPITGSALLANIIPPSILGVILAGLAQISVAKILIGGIMPGILMIALFSLYIIITSAVNPSLAPPYVTPPVPLSTKISGLVYNVLPLFAIIFAVLGSILFGIATPTEAAAVGVFAGFIVSLLFRRLSFEKIKETFYGSLEIAAFILMICAGSVFFAQILSFTGVTSELVRIAMSAPMEPIYLVIMMHIVVLVMGCFLDQPSTIMICIPIFLPILNTLGVNLIWFGVIMLINVTIGMLTPPYGVLLFIIQRMMTKKISFEKTVLYSLPFLLITLLVVVLTIIFPQIILWLPGKM